MYSLYWKEIYTTTSGSFFLIRLGRQLQSFKEAGVDILHFNVQFCLVTGRRVNACTSPDVPEPLYQWEAFRALAAQPAHAPFRDTIHLG
jgi:hypothetical protein